MPIDTSIITGMQQPDFSSSLTQGAQLSSLVQQKQIKSIEAQQAKQQFADQQAVRNAYANNTTVDSNGNPSLDRQGVLSDLADTAPHLVTPTAQSFAQNDLAMQKSKIESAQMQHAAVAQLAGGVTDQASLDAAHKTAQTMGLNTNGIPTIYDQSTPAIMKGIQMQALSAKDQLDQQQKALENQNKAQQLAIDSKKLGMDVFKTYGNAMGPGGAPAPAKGGGAGSGGPSAVDPSSLVSYHVPPDRQAKALDEIDAAQNTARNAPKILQAFDNAANNIHAADFVPGMHNADQKALHALMGPTFKDVEGTVRQAAMDNMNENTTPQFGDDANTIATKRAALVGYLQSKTSAPTNKAFGIDLTKYKSTALDPSVIAGSPTKNAKTNQVAADIHPALQGMSIADLKKLEAKMSAVGQK